MSWLLENWFGSKESLEQVREDIHEYLHNEFYLGVSGIENPQQSANRVESKELFLSMNGPWDAQLDEAEQELLQYVHDELPPVVRDEVGVIPFFTQATVEGYLVLAYIRNATDRNVLLQKLPLSLVTAEGEEVAKKTFDLMTSGPVDSMSSRPAEFMFRWEEFDRIPEQEVPLTIVYKKPQKQRLEGSHELNMGLSASEQEQYLQKAAAEAPVEAGQVDLQVLAIKPNEDNGLKVVVVFRNGLEKRLEFTEVPILVHDKDGEAVARVNYTLQNMKVEANSQRVWAFDIPSSSIKKAGVDVTELTAFIPQARQRKKQETYVAPETEDNKGLLQ
ncbi:MULTISPECIES: SLAP domain-containing protein [Brevibacillus]|jgi:SLAP domain-containing protein|uniref:SLAP domain-containing protein n=1 Tax=Brevibacillus parabrevis TaxID=54914 RepID=A0A4Y3PLR1_BREPA|nr:MULTISPECIES: SLAP domain-containing protein [Brevibacillus]MBU8713652.1 SLAP domain-containing protein [Brevibacillus parabrevis]MDH6350898.1 SLAP domain-containing protein [Brevibacillus sp. 1238]MDR4997853.1 SLAP domain-containing protein [Brevibacillus parabrevis]MED1722431.1 SLAP domain-containing protein [Brevibacillus parabrevis]MED2256148.1 SLAP domain-containing protein [Brevibacillus parabrevis]